MIETPQLSIRQSTPHSAANNISEKPFSQTEKSLLEILLQAENTSSFISNSLKGKKKKKKTKSKHL